MKVLASRHVNALRSDVERKDFRNALTQVKLIAGAGLYKQALEKPIGPPTP